MLIRRASLLDGRATDLRILGDRIAAMGELTPDRHETVLDASGGLLLPGLHDHHIHIAALAASLDSVRCGPPDVQDIAGLATALDRPGGGWLRGIGYHESVAGMLDRAMLDGITPGRPVRVQHRGGRMWFLNSAGLAALLDASDPPPGLDRETGRLFDEDAWLKRALGSEPPSFAAVGVMLAACGVTGVTEISPANDRFMARHFAAEHAAGALPQRVLLAGRADLREADMAAGVRLGPVKLHLHEADLPPLDEMVAITRDAHSRGRPVAVHCATGIELVYTLAMFEEAGAMAGDRIEHASVTPDFALETIARLGLAVVTQPHFIAERGDAYARDVEPETLPLLYRLRAFAERGIVLAGGSDAPFGRADPWAAMAAACTRRTAGGIVLGIEEALTPEEAIDLFLRDPERLDRTRALAVGMAADLCLLDRPWRAARTAPSSAHVRATFIAGRRVHDRVDQPPAQGGGGIDPPA